MGNNFIDANFFDRTGSAEDTAVDQILKWREDVEEEFSLWLPYSVKAEIEHPNTPMDVKRKAAGCLYSEQVELMPREVETHAKIAALIQGNAKAGQHANLKMRSTWWKATNTGADTSLRMISAF
jgi:hypothetical protein